MGDVKSTLELVMERTRNMTLSDDERHAQKLDEYKKRLKGLVQKFMDSMLNVEQFEKALESLKSRKDDRDNKMLGQEISARIEFENDNSRLFILLETICGKEISGVETIVQNYKESMKEASWEAGKQIKTRFAEQYQIYGSAFQPNIEAAPGWVEIADKIKSHYTKMLKEEIDDLRPAMF